MRTRAEGDRGPAAVRLLCALLLGAALAPPAGAQERLSPGSALDAALDDADAVDEHDYVHDLYILTSDDEGRVVVSAESADFDVLLEWGVLGDHGFQPVGLVDDSEGLASPTDARLWLELEAAEDAPTAIRVSSYDGGPDGRYHIRVEAVEPGRLQVRDVDPGARTAATLTRSDGLVDGRFADLYRFEGAKGERAFVALEAEFDAYLELRPPPDGPAGVGPWEDDDGFGGSDAFLEVDLPVDGTYELVVTAYGQEVGRYTLRLWSAPALVPEVEVTGVSTPQQQAAELLGIAFTEEERAPLRNVDGVWENEALGFRFPDPPEDLRQSVDVQAAFGITEETPNAYAWALTSEDEETGIVAFAIRAPGRVTQELFEFMVGSMAREIGGTDLQQISEDLSWERRTYELRFREPTATFDEQGEMFCRATDATTVPGHIVCLVGAGSGAGSFMELFRQLELD